MSEMIDGFTAQENKNICSGHEEDVMEENRKCVICKTAIGHKKRDAIYCSRFCYNKMITEQFRTENAARIVDRECVACKKIFRPKTNRSTKYCSVSCTYIARNEKMRVFHTKKECSNCHQEFQPTRVFQMFCCPECRSNASMFKKRYEMTAQDYHALPVTKPDTIAAQIEADRTRAQAVAKELEEQELPLCTRCAVNKVRDPEAMYMQCPSCILVTEAEEKAKQKCDHMYDSTNRCGICGELNASV